MDVIALFTMHELGFLERLRQRFDKILVSQLTLDDVRQMALLERTSWKGKSLTREGWRSLKPTPD